MILYYSVIEYSLHEYKYWSQLHIGKKEAIMLKDIENPYFNCIFHWKNLKNLIRSQLMFTCSALGPLGCQKEYEKYFNRNIFKL